MCYHFIINVSATFFCWLDTGHQKTLSKAVCTYLSTNCHVYISVYCVCVGVYVRVYVRAGRNNAAGWMTNRPGAGLAISFSSCRFITYIQKSQKLSCRRDATKASARCFEFLVSSVQLWVHSEPSSLSSASIPSAEDR